MLQARVAAWTAILLMLILSSTSSSDEDFIQHGAHVHGAATLLLAGENDMLIVHFASPGVNLVGFESRQPNDGQLSAIDEILAVLEDIATVLTFPESARCALQSAEIIVTGIDDPRYTSSQNHSHNHGHAHMDFIAEYTVTCERKENMDNIALPLFTRWPGIETLNVNWLLDHSQGSTRLSASKAALLLR